ncbi:RNA polymerase sigma factor [Kaarinaea lacus]
MRDVDQITDHIPRLRRYARALMSNAVAADDLVQDTLERAVSRFSLWRRHSDLRSWLFTLMHNIYVNQGLAANRRRHMAVDAPDADPPSVTATQEEGLALRDMHRAITQLPDEYREVVLLVGLEQMSYDDVARVLDIPKGTVMSRLSRGREKLRQLMAGESIGTSSESEPVLRRIK